MKTKCAIQKGKLDSDMPVSKTMTHQQKLSQDMKDNTLKRSGERLHTMTPKQK